MPPYPKKSRATLGLAPAIPLRKRRSYLTRDEWKRVMRELEKRSIRDQALVRLMYEAGLRASEPGVMRISYLDCLGQGKVYVWRGKGSKAGDVEVTDKTRSIIRSWYREMAAERKKTSLRPEDPLFPGYGGRGLSSRAVYNVWRTLAEAAKLDKDLAHPHVLKHSRCQHLLEAADEHGEHPSVMLGVIAEIVGHAKAQTTLAHYLKTSKRARALTKKLTKNYEEDE